MVIRSEVRVGILILTKQIPSHRKLNLLYSLTLEEVSNTSVLLHLRHLVILAGHPFAGNVQER